MILKFKKLNPALISSLVFLSSCATYLEKRTHDYLKEGTKSSYALVGANLIPINKSGIITNQTLLIKDGRIEAIGDKDTVIIPKEAQTIDMTNQYILPGFTDMHVHLADQRDFLHLLKHGVTSIRQMADGPWWGKLLGFPDVLELRRKIKQQQLIGPDIFSCGPILDGYPAQNALNLAIETPQQAINAVEQTVKAGFDCVKVYNRLSRANFDQVAKTAKQHNIPVMGHVPFDVGIDRALEAPMVTIEHLNGYINNFAGQYRLPEEQLPVYAHKTRLAGVYNCPTLVIWDHHPPYNKFSQVEKDPRYGYIPYHLKAFWQISVPYLFRVTFSDLEHYPDHLLKLSKNMVRILYEQGSPLLIGTDANIAGVYPGSTILREMELFAEAGVPPQIILESTTINAAKVMRQEQEKGTIEVGKRADLVVLKANPLEDIKHVHQITGIMLQGRWLPREDIERMIEESR